MHYTRKNKKEYVIINIRNPIDNSKQNLNGIFRVNNSNTINNLLEFRKYYPKLKKCENRVQHVLSKFDIKNMNGNDDEINALLMDDDKIHISLYNTSDTTRLLSWLKENLYKENKKCNKSKTNKKSKTIKKGNRKTKKTRR